MDMGPDYPYVKYINGTKRMRMGPKWSNIADNIAGLGAYVEILVEGGGRASRTGKPLGNKFFLKTAGKCKAVDRNLNPVMVESKTKKNNDGKPSKEQKMVDRYMFINNIPMGKIPLISSAAGGADFSTFRGLIPGMLSNLNVLNPSDLFKSFTMSSEPKCAKISMDTVDVNNVKRRETHYVPVTEIKMIDSCLFPDKRNRFNGKRCTEAFGNMEADTSLQSQEVSLTSLQELITSGDPIAKFYFVMITLLMTYIVHRLMKKR